MSMANQLLSAMRELMLQGGCTVDLYEPGGTLKMAAAKGSFVNWTVEDEALRNDYDKEAQKFYLEVGTAAPKKLDYLLHLGNRWTVLDVHTRIISDQPICHVCVVRK